MTPDKRKGEQIILITDHPNPDISHLRGWAQSHGVPELALPKRIIVVEHIPVLGTGKIDYVAVGRMADGELKAAEAAAQKEREEAAAAMEVPAGEPEEESKDEAAPEESTDRSG